MAVEPLGKAARERLQRRFLDQLFSLLRLLILSSAGVACVWLMFEGLAQFAGKDTSVLVDAAIDVVADLKFVASLTVGGAFFACWLRERRLRHRKVEALQDRIRQLETMIDPKRTSSKLTTKGKTNPRDRR